MSLKEDLAAFFANCDKRPYTELEFAKELTKCIADNYKKSVGTTTDSGTIASGVLTAKGTISSIEGSNTSCENIIYETCVSLKTMTVGGNIVFATGLANGVNSIAQEFVITCSVVGTVLKENIPSPISGTAKGNLTAQPSPLITKLSDLFLEFNYKNNESIEQYNNRLQIGTTYKDVQDCYTSRLSEEILNFFNSGVVNTNGTENLSGSVGVGQLTMS